MRAVSGLDGSERSSAGSESRLRRHSEKCCGRKCSRNVERPPSRSPQELLDDIGLVRAEGLEPSRTLRSNGFSYPPRLSPPPTAFAMGFGVWTIPSPCPELAPGVRYCPSSLYTFPAVSGRAWLGIAMLQGSPNLSSSAPPVSRRALKFFGLSPMRLPISPRPHGFKVARNDE